MDDMVIFNNAFGLKSNILFAINNIRKNKLNDHNIKYFTWKTI